MAASNLRQIGQIFIEISVSKCEMSEMSHRTSFAKNGEKNAFAMALETKSLFASSFFIQEHMYVINYQMRSHRMCLPIVLL